jgi:hypothetical protein
MKRSPNVALAALSALLLWAGAAPGSPRLLDHPRELPQLSGPDLDADRARRATLGPDAPEVKVESAVLERARALGQALSVRTTRPALDPRRRLLLARRPDRRPGPALPAHRRQGDRPRA